VQHPLSWADRVKQGQSSKQALTSESDSSDSAQVRKDLQSKIAEVNDLKLEFESLRMEKAQYQEEIKRQVQEQVNTVIQDYLDKKSGPTGVTQNQFETFLELQNKNFRDLSLQLMQMVIAQRNDSEAQKGVVTVPYGKRSVVGTT
jgi:predicted nuclease with TOPRIM domain